MINMNPDTERNYLYQVDIGSDHLITFDRFYKALDCFRTMDGRKIYATEKDIYRKTRYLIYF